MFFTAVPNLLTQVHAHFCAHQLYARIVFELYQEADIYLLFRHGQATEGSSNASQTQLWGAQQRLGMPRDKNEQ